MGEESEEQRKLEEEEEFGEGRPRARTIFDNRVNKKDINTK